MYVCSLYRYYSSGAPEMQMLLVNYTVQIIIHKQIYITMYIYVLVASSPTLYPLFNVAHTFLFSACIIEKWVKGWGRG